MNRSQLDASILGIRHLVPERLCAGWSEEDVKCNLTYFRNRLLNGLQQQSRITGECRYVDVGELPHSEVAIDCFDPVYPRFGLPSCSLEVLVVPLNTRSRKCGADVAVVFIQYAYMQAPLQSEAFQSSPGTPSLKLPL